MLDYYELLGIPRNINEDKLNKKLDDVLNALENDKSKKLFEKNVDTIAYNFYYGFKKTLENYGSKANYDKALLRSKKICKVIVLSKDTIKKIALTFVIAGTITGTVVGYSVNKKNNYTDVYIPSYGMSISEICDHYGISPTELKLESLLEKIKNKDAQKDVNVNVKNDRVDELNEKIDNQRQKYYDDSMIQNKIYSFKYRVKAGDTVSSLISKYNALDSSFSSNMLIDGEVITIYTKDSEVAETMQILFDEEAKEKQPVSFEYYVIQSGDTLPKIANKFGVTPDSILRYNEGLDLQTIYAGETIKIQQYENVKTR